MKYLRHRNGNGKYWGHNAFIDANSFLDRESNLFDNSDVWDSRLIDATVAYSSKIRQSVLLKCSVGAPDYPSEIVGAFLHLTRVQGGTVLGATVLNCHISGNAVVQGSCYLENCHLSGAVVVENHAVLKGIALIDKMRVGYGVWTRPPRYLEVRDAAGEIVVGVTESTEDHAYIGCQRKPMRDWIDKRTFWAKVGGWDEDIMTQVLETFLEWLK